MKFDFDDLSQSNNRLDLFWQLKNLRPDFKCSIFAVPALGTEYFWSQIPSFMELCVHGWLHPTPRECENWTEEQMEELINRPVVRKYFKPIFRAPGWQISDGCYAVLNRYHWTVSDQPYNRDRRPEGLKVYEVGDNYHFHIQDIGSNGMVESWDTLVKAVQDAPSFEFISESK